MTSSGDRFLTRTGIPVTVRPIAASDREALHAAFLKLSRESRYRRFLGPIEDLGPAELSRLTEIDHRDHEALVAIAADGELVAVARFIREADDPERAEVAVTVADDWQGQGLGTELLLRLEARARAEGVHTLTALCLVENREMLGVFSDLPGARCSLAEPRAGTVEVELALAPDHERVDVADALRVGAGAFAGAHHPALPG